VATVNDWSVQVPSRRLRTASTVSGPVATGPADTGRWRGLAAQAPVSMAAARTATHKDRDMATFY
jgi:hypothetical protein